MTAHFLNSRRTIRIGMALLCLMFGGEGRAADDWPEVFSDLFDRSHPSPLWIEDYGGNLSIANGRLRFRGVAKFESTVSLPREDFQVRMELELPEGQAHVSVRDGALFAGGGLQKDRGETFGVTLRVSDSAGEVISEVFPAAEMNETRERLVVTVIAGEPVALVMEYRNGRGIVTVNGQIVLDAALPPARSEFNRFVGIQAEDIFGSGAELQSFVISAPANNPNNIPLQRNTPAENRSATVEIWEVPDPEAAGVLFQEALDSLPPQGGVVLLPEGTFPLRRSLELRSHVSLRGRGAGRTVLQVPRPTSVAMDQLVRKSDRTLQVEDAAWLEGIRVGDSLVFSVNGPRGLIVIGKQDKELTLDRDLPVDFTKEKGLHHFFRAINCEEAEFVEVSDLSIVMEVAPRPPDGGAFLPAVRFRSVAGGKISRMEIGPWSGDGMYITSSECLVTDNTVRQTKMGIHFGGSELNLCTGNLVTESSFCGFYYCSYPRDCILSGNTFDGFQGLADPGDTGNLITYNDVTAKSALEGNWLALVYGNKLSELFIGMIPWKEDQPKRKINLDHFLIARNRIASLLPGVYADDSNISGLLWADNTGTDGNTPVDPPEFPNSLVLNASGLPVSGASDTAGCGRNEAVPPDELRLPVLDGREFYDPTAPDLGFQKALDQLTEGGGSLQLPGGRYPLSVPLKVPSGVTLVGYGVATVLCPAPGGENGSLIVVSDTTGTIIRDLSILGEYGTQATRHPAISINNCKDLRMEAVDIRGWEGDGLAATGSDIQVIDSRAFGTAGVAFSFLNSKISLDCLLVKSCAAGIMAAGTIEGSSLRNVIASRNQGAGITLRESRGVALSACLSSRNGEDGFLIMSSHDLTLLGSIAMQNSLSRPGEFAGVQLAQITTGCTVAFCLLFDAQGPVATQRIAVREDSSCEGNVIRANIETDRARAALLRTGNSPDSSISAQGDATVATDNIP